MWAGASDWALRRLLKVLLKRNLKGVLATEVDVEQLRVSLGAGCLELTDVLLSRQWLAERAPPGLEVVSGYIGRLRLDLAITSLTCSVTAEDVLVTVRPCSSGGGGSGAGAGAGAPPSLGAGAPAEAPVAGGPATFGIDEGVRLVAAGVETLLQRMNVSVARLSVRVEGAAGIGTAASIMVAAISYGAAPAQADEELTAAAATARRVCFAGLSLAVGEGAPPLLAPLDGEADVTVSWPLDPLPAQQPHVFVGVRLEALHLQVRPPDVAGLLRLAASYADAHAAAAQATALQAALPRAADGVLAPAPAPLPARLTAAPRHHSVLEELMLPGCDAMVQDALAESVADAGSSTADQEEEGAEFCDAQLLLGSLQAAFSSAMASSYNSAGGDGGAADLGASLVRQGGDAADLDLDAFAMHDLAASIREAAGEHGEQWRASLAAPSLTLSLLYPEEGGGPSPHYAPRLVVEVLEVCAAAEPASGMSLTVGEVEVAEHLPFPSASPSASPASSAAGGWLPAEEMARVPCVLPFARGAAWPSPTSAGDYPLPDQGASLGLVDTLAQLSDLSQATVYQSATLYQSSAYQSATALTLERSSMLQQPMAFPEGVVVPRVQIAPVLACSGPGAALVLHRCSVQQAAQTGGREAAAEVALMLQPVCMWCTLPLLARVQLFAAAVQRHATEQLHAANAQQQAELTASKAAVAAAISDILQHQQQEKQLQQHLHTIGSGPGAEASSSGAPVRLSIYLPAVCLVAAVPDAKAQQPKYFAVEAAGSSSQLLASMGGRLGNQQPQALLASLHESGVQPTLVLRRAGGGSGSGDSSSSSGSVSSGCSSSSSSVDGCSDAAAAQPAWTCTLRAGAVAVHAVGDAGAGDLGDSVLGHALAATQVASIAGEGPRGTGGLSIQGSWQQPGVPQSLDQLERLWAAAGQEPGRASEPAALWERLRGGAPLLVTAAIDAPLRLTLERGMLAAAARLADGLLQLTPAPPPEDAATPAALRLLCNAECTLAVPCGAPCTLAARGIHVVACSGIAGLAGSSAVAAAVGSLELTRTGAGGGAALVAHAAGQQQPADERCTPALQLSALLRPTGEPYQLGPSARYVVPCRGRVGVCSTGLTLLLDEAGQLACDPDLQAFFAAGAGSPSAAAASVAGGAPPPPGPALDWAVWLASSCVRYEPGDPGLAAAVLTAGCITWQARQGEAQSSVELRRLALHIAGPAARGCACGSPEGAQQGTPAALPTLPGFHQVAAEAGVSVQLPAGGGAEAGGAAAAMQEVVVSNRGLTITLSRHTLLLLQCLAAQLPGRSGSGTAGGGGPASPGAECSHGGVANGGGAPNGTPVDVMRGVLQAAYASPSRAAEHPLEASVFLDGGWYDPERGGANQQYAMSPAGSPPAMVDDFLAGPDGRAAPGEQEGQGVWYSGEAELREDYVALQPPSEEEAATSPGSPSYDCRALPPGHPAPLRRLSLRDLSITLTLADTFATVLLPEDAAGSSSSDSSDELEWLPGSPIKRRGEGGGAGGTDGSRQQGHHAREAAAEGEDEEELVPVSAQVQARLEGVCLQVDSFAEAGCGGGAGACLQSRCALLVRHLEVRDSFQPRQGGGAGAAAGTAAAATGWAELRRMLGYHASPHRVRAAQACMLQLVVEAIRAEPGAEVEYRLHVQLLPLLLHLDQAALAFLQHFFAPPDGTVLPGGGTSGDSQRPGGTSSSGGGCSSTQEQFFQRCEVQPFTLTINYRPHRVDLAALTSGQLAEVLNLVPWGGVSLQFRHLRLFGMQGLGGVGTAVASAWMEDIVRHQAHRFVGGLAPIKSICRVSSAAAQLLAIPRQQLYKRSSGGGGGLSLAVLADEDFRRQMRRGLAGFVRAVALEAVTLGATVAGGAEVALAGEQSASHTVGVKKALRQASAHLRSSASGPRTAASAAATAVRTALLGVRNTLDREHTLERRLNS